MGSHRGQETDVDRLVESVPGIGLRLNLSGAVQVIGGGDSRAA
jgi:hypothetical protein